MLAAGSAAVTAVVVAVVTAVVAGSVAFTTDVEVNVYDPRRYRPVELAEVLRPNSTVSLVLVPISQIMSQYPLRVVLAGITGNASA